MRGSCFVLITFLVVSKQFAIGQIKGLTDLHTAQARLDQYLVEADSTPTRKGLRVRASKTILLKSQEKLIMEEMSMLHVSDAQKKLKYTCNQRSEQENSFPNRSESFWLEGRLKMKSYGVRSPLANGFVLEVEQDPSKPDPIKSNMFGPVVRHFEIDPYGLAISNHFSAAGTFSRIDNVIKYWITKCKCVKEEYNAGKLTSTWESQPHGFRSELLFDDEQGGMPVLMRYFSVDSQLRPTKEYLSETRTIWKKSISEDEELWVPIKIELISSHVSSDENCVYDIAWIANDELERVITSIDWKSLFDAKMAMWFQTVSSSLDQRDRRKGRNATSFDLK